MGWLQSFIEGIAEHDPASWGSHWVIAVGISILGGILFGPFGALITSELVLLYFTAREVENWIRLGHLPGKKRDCILDWTGPALCHVLFWLGYTVL